MQAAKSAVSWRLFLFLCLLSESSSQDFGGQTQFICTSVPKNMDICAATLQNSVPGDDLKSTVIQLRETVLQQKETIMNQKETIRELTSKLARCESQSGAEPGDARPGGRRKEAGTKNTMGDVSRGPADTLTQLSQTLQSLKQRLENLEVGSGEPFSLIIVSPSLSLSVCLSLPLCLSVFFGTLGDFAQSYEIFYRFKYNLRMSVVCNSALTRERTGSCLNEPLKPTIR